MLWKQHGVITPADCEAAVAILGDQDYDDLVLDVPYATKWRDELANECLLLVGVGAGAGAGAGAGDEAVDGGGGD